MLRHTKQVVGFTVVELIVVIAMIGIIATIGLVSYNSVLVSARNTDRLNELTAWENAFTLHASTKRSYPSVPADGGYCLGKGFPSAADLAPHLPTGYSISPPSAGYCRNLLVTGTASTQRYGINDALNTQLLAITEKSPGSTEFKTAQFNRWPTAIGPYAEFQSGTITLSHIFEGENCPANTQNTYSYPSGDRLVCSITLPTNYSYDTVGP